MTTTSTQTRRCRRCLGSGHDPGPTYDVGQSAILDRLGELGAERKAITDRKGYSTTPGRLRLDEIYTEIRLLVTEGRSLNIQARDVIDALGITSAAFYNRSGPYQADR